MTDVIPVPLLPPVPKPWPATCACARQPEACAAKPAGDDGLCKHCHGAECQLFGVAVPGAAGAPKVMHVDFTVGAPVAGRYEPLAAV